MSPIRSLLLSVVLVSVFACKQQECLSDFYTESDLNFSAELISFDDEEELSSTQLFTLDFEGFESSHRVMWLMGGEALEGQSVELQGQELQIITVTVSDGACEISRTFEYYFGEIFVGKQIRVLENAEVSCDLSIYDSEFVANTLVEIYDVIDGARGNRLDRVYIDPFGRFIFQNFLSGEYIVRVIPNDNFRVVTEIECSERSVLDEEGYSKILYARNPHDLLDIPFAITAK